MDRRLSIGLATGLAMFTGQVLTADIAEAQRTLAATAAATGSGTTGQLNAAIANGSPIVTPTGNMTSGCANTGCPPDAGKPKGGGFDVKSLVKGFAIQAGVSCLAGAISDGEAHRNTVGGLLLNPLAAEACFQLFEELKGAVVVSGPSEIEVYCKDNNLYGLKMTTSVQGQVFPGQLEAMREKAERAGMEILVNNSDLNAPATKLITVDIRQVVHTEADYTLAEITDITNALATQLNAAGVGVEDGVKHGRPHLSFTNVVKAKLDTKIMHGDKETRAAAMMGPFQALETFAGRINKAYQNVIDDLAAKHGPACIQVVQENVRLASRNAKFNADGSCTSNSTFQVGGKNFKITKGWGAFLPKGQN